MIAHLRGTVADRSEEHAIIDVAGVGYLVHMTVPDLLVLPLDEETRVHVYTHVREDQITLFAFAERPARTVFMKLIGISGVGPKLGLSLLSAYSLAELKDIAILGNVAALKKVKGVGKKTAERLALELKDLLADLAVPASSRAASSTSARAPAGVWEDTMSALIHLGYSQSQADDAIAQARHEGLDGSDLNGILTFALATLRRK